MKHTIEADEDQISPGSHLDDFGNESPNERPMNVIAVYEVDLMRGGAEEGGWWFEAGQLVRVVRAIRNNRKAQEYCNRLNAKLRSRVFGPNEGRRELSSVISEGEYQACMFEGTAPAYFPEQRPHYE